MLGSNLGKKVTAGVVQDEYKQFLKNKPDEKKVLSAEERKMAKRVEMRKRGVFVKADDVDEVPTVLEKSECGGQVMAFVLPEKPTVWKKDATKKRKTKSRDTNNKTAKRNDKKDAAPKKKLKVLKPDPSVKSIPSAKPKKEPSVITPTGSAPKTKSPESSDKTIRRKVVVEPPVPEVPTVPTPEVKPIQEPKYEEPEVKPLEKEKSEEHETKSEEAKPIESVKEASVKSEEPPMALARLPSPTDSKKAPASGPISVPMAEKQEAFEKLDDDEFEKMTSDADEKEILKLAPKLLKVAKKHAAMEKCLKPEENEVLAKFFSGKQKLDAVVLAVLDAALDKIIDYLQKNNCAIDDETREVMKKRNKLKAAMMKEFLVSPQYLPKTWTAKFNEWKSEAEKQKNGINWFRVMFSYPKHKSFDDGPEDTFGNFHRRHRTLLMGLILGPGDVKSFEETKREDDCQGMFLDTKIIENAAEGKEIATSASRTVHSDGNSLKK